MRGKKDYVAVKTGGNKEHKKRRLVLNNVIFA
jgi:hypothetical protein